MPSRYAGARGRGLDLEQVRSLGRSHVIQPKLDGAYAEVHTDGCGRVAQVLSRTGRPYRTDLEGCRVATGAAVLAGELEAHTERGIATAAARGWQVVHLFDALELGGRDLAREPYRVRRDALLRDRVALEMDVGDDRPWTVDRRGVVHDAAGRFAELGVPRAWRRAPVVPQLPTWRAPELWDQAVAGELEGLVVVALDAPLGARRAKRKLKPVDTLDCVVLAADRRRARVRTFTGIFVVGCAGLTLDPGEHVEIRHEGYYQSGIPRFPRIVRRRPDLAGHRGARHDRGVDVRDAGAGGA